MVALRFTIKSSIFQTQISRTPRIDLQPIPPPTLHTHFPNPSERRIKDEIASLETNASLSAPKLGFFSGFRIKSGTTKNEYLKELFHTFSLSHFPFNLQDFPQGNSVFDSNLLSNRIFLCNIYSNQNCVHIVYRNQP